MIPPKRFDIFPPDWGMLKKSRLRSEFSLTTYSTYILVHCSADHERDWPPCKVVFFGLATNALNVRNNNNNNYTSWSEAYFVTLIDRCSFLCVSGQRGAIAKSMHEEHLCVVALTSNGARNPVLSACLLPPCVIAYCSSSTSR